MTNVLVVNYDLRAPGRNYEALWTRLIAWRATRVLKSTWIIKANSTPAALRDDLQRYVDKNDGLLIGSMSEWAWSNVEAGSDQSLRNAA